MSFKKHLNDFNKLLFKLTVVIAPIYTVLSFIYSLRVCCCNCYKEIVIYSLSITLLLYFQTIIMYLITYIIVKLLIKYLENE